MKVSNSIKLSALAVASVLALSACGGGSGGSSDNNGSSSVAKTAIGTFLDSAVQGIEVFQGGKSLGKTDAKGQFTYTVGGGAVTFKLGELVLGSTMPKSVITPADLPTDGVQITRILQVLQSVDSDSNADNGITISDDVAKRFVSADFASILQEEDNTRFETALKPKLNTNQQVVSDDKAQDHFAKTAQSSAVSNSPELSKLADKFVGYWQQSCDDGSQEVFQLTKSSTPNTLVGTGKVITRKYQNDDCTGTFVDGSYDSSTEPLTVKIIAQATNAQNQTVLHILHTETDDKGNTANFFDSVLWVNDNTFQDDLTFTRSSSLAFNNQVVTPQTNLAQGLSNRFNGKYWKTCYQTNQGSELSFLSSSVNGTTVNFQNLVRQEFSNATCSGTPNNTTKKIENNYEDFSKAVLNGTTLTIAWKDSSFIMTNNNSFTVTYNENGENKVENYTLISANQVPN